MNQAAAVGAIRDSLRSALDRGALPETAGEQAAQLLTRLNRPVAVIVAGGTGSGKSSLVNMLVGEPVIPERSGLPVVEIAYGQVRRSIVVDRDGRRSERPGNALTEDLAPDAALVRVELPARPLEHMSLTELRVTGAPADRASAMDLIAQQADIVLWCTQVFDATELGLWRGLPDRIKDHAFLVLTKADRLLMQEALVDRIAALEPVVAEEFHSLFPVATLQAMSARPGGDGTGKPELWKASGGQALARAVARQVALGRMADADRALAFMTRCGLSVEDPAPAAQSAANADAETAADGDGAEDPIAAAVSMLTERARELTRIVAVEGGDSRSAVLDHCLSTMESLCEMLAGPGGGDPASAWLQAGASEGLDMLVLLNLERTDDAAEDAVDLLLQLRKELAEATVPRRP